MEQLIESKGKRIKNSSRNKTFLFISLIALTLLFVNGVSAVVVCELGNYENQTFGILWELLEEVDCHGETMLSVIKLAFKFIIILVVVGGVAILIRKFGGTVMKFMKG